MNLFNIINRRRSVRKYSEEKLSSEVIDNILNYAGSIKQLDGCKVRFEIVGKDKVSGGKAPHYIFAFSEKNVQQYINVGYVMQEIDLYIQSLGLGSLWLGLGVAKEKTDEYIIMMAFGNTTVPERKNEAEFTRLNLNDISNEDNKIARTARLAPSATNSQPWKIEFLDNCVRINYFGRGILQKILKAKMSMIDLGIMTKIIELSLINDNKKIEKIAINTKDKHIAVDINYR